MKGEGGQGKISVLSNVFLQIFNAKVLASGDSLLFRHVGISTPFATIRKAVEEINMIGWCKCFCVVGLLVFVYGVSCALHSWQKGTFDPWSLLSVVGIVVFAINYPFSKPKET